MLSGPVILLKITLEWSINLQYIWRRDVVRVLMNDSPSNIFWILLLVERYHQNCQAVLAASDMNGLNHRNWHISLTWTRPLLNIPHRIKVESHDHWNVQKSMTFQDFTTLPSGPGVESYMLSKGPARAQTSRSLGPKDFYLYPRKNSSYWIFFSKISKNMVLLQLV